MFHRRVQRLKPPLKITKIGHHGCRDGTDDLPCEIIDDCDHGMWSRCFGADNAGRLGARRRHAYDVARNNIQHFGKLMGSMVDPYCYCATPTLYPPQVSINRATIGWYVHDCKLASTSTSNIWTSLDLRYILKLAVSSVTGNGNAWVLCARSRTVGRMKRRLLRRWHHILYCIDKSLNPRLFHVWWVRGYRYHHLLKRLRLM